MRVPWIGQSTCRRRRASIGLARGLAAEEGDLDAVGQILVDQHGDVLAVLQRLRQPERRVAAGRDQRAHLDRADLLDGAVGGLDVRPAEQDRSIQPMRDGGQRRQFPIAEMAGEDQRRLAVVPHLVEQFAGPLRQFDAAVLGMIAIVIPDMVEMGELGADAAEIVPDAGQDRLDLLRRFFREGGLQIFAADAVLAQPAADELRDAAEKIGGLDRVEIARGAQQPDRQPRPPRLPPAAWRRREGAPWCEGAGGSSRRAARC